MKSFKTMVLSLAFVAGAAQATSLHPDTFRNEVAPVLGQIDVATVGTRGDVVKTNHNRPYTEVTIAIPVTVSTRSACVAFVGQQTNQESSGLQVIRAIGASDPVNDVCIAIMPMPINTKLTVKMKILTGGFVPAQPIQRQIVQIMPLGLHEITLDMGNNSVTVRPLQRLPR